MVDYELLNAQVKALSEADDNTVGLLANTSALLREAGRWWWVGFYLVHGDELWLGPFQGPLACMRIPKGRGVCGKAWESGRTIVVPDVELFPGHIACSSQSRSEIVVPIFSDNRVVAVLDIDSTDLDAFSETDRRGLESIADTLSATF